MESAYCPALEAETDRALAFGRDDVRIGSQRMFLWRAVNAEGEVLDMLVQKRRNKKAAEGCCGSC
jgi:transposase-like protein